jgi:hypothetical protein
VQEVVERKAKEQVGEREKNKKKRKGKKRKKARLVP